MESAPDEDQLLPALREFCSRFRRLPQPTTFLDSGQSAAVFTA